MNTADILLSHVTEAHQQVIYPMGLEPWLTANFPTTWTQPVAGQWLNPVSTATRQWMTENHHKTGPVFGIGFFSLS